MSTLLPSEHDDEMVRMVIEYSIKAGSFNNLLIELKCILT